MSKPCFKCGKTLSIEEFYRHSMMADGHLNKCKSCCRQDVVANRRKRLDYYREYDRKRFHTERRQDTLRRRAASYRAANPEKNEARQAVARAVRSGRLVKKPCEICGCERVDAHHDDYSRPLDVRWLCRVHHLMEHGRYILQ